jgi:hypothetical protein
MNIEKNSILKKKGISKDTPLTAIKVYHEIYSM